LWNYAATLKKYNLGSSCTIMVQQNAQPDDLSHFQRMYVRIESITKGFLTGYKKIIGIDGCFLKGPYGRQLSSVIRGDGNDNM